MANTANEAVVALRAWADGIGGAKPSVRVVNDVLSQLAAAEQKAEHWFTMYGGLEADRNDRIDTINKQLAIIGQFQRALAKYDPSFIPTGSAVSYADYCALWREANK